MNKKVNILFLGAGRRVSLAEKFLLSAKKKGIKLKIFSYELEKDLPISFVTEVIIGKKWSESEIEGHLVYIIDKYDIDIVIPFMDEATVLISRIKEKNKDLSQRTLFLVSSFYICTTFYDKKLSYEWFNKLNIPSPKKSKKKFPKIIKKRHGFGSRDMTKVNNEHELKMFFYNKNIKKYIVQPYIDGTEYTVDCYVSLNGSIKCIVPRIRIEVRSGEVSKSMTVKNHRLINLSRKILNCGDFVGPITLQFIEESLSKDTYIIEINPRFGGGVINSIEAGADIPFYILKDFFSEKIEPLENFTEKLKMLRADREFFICK